MLIRCTRDLAYLDQRHVPPMATASRTKVHKPRTQAPSSTGHARGEGALRTIRAVQLKEGDGLQAEAHAKAEYGE